jgi:hypothetical protein
VSRSYVSLRRKSIPQYRQKVVLGLLPVPGYEVRNPPENHHGVDVRAIRKKIELNRKAIAEGKVIFPGLGVSKRPMTIVTSLATYVVGWASRGGRRAISIAGESTPTDGKILFLHMGEPMVFAGARGKIYITPPVIFIGRRQYHGIGVPEWCADELRDRADFASSENLSFADTDSFAA